MGLISRWARLASYVPHFANLLTQTPALARWLKAIAGIAPERALPPLAVQPFTRWSQQRAPKPHTGWRVLLWPDTFNNYFRPETARAAVAVLEAVRAAPPDSLIIANGFSCREQIDTHTDRRALHLAEVLHLARQAPTAMPREERLAAHSQPADGTHRLTPVEKAMVAASLMLLSAGVLGYARTRRR
jgi:hypothetical protein